MFNPIAELVIPIGIPIKEEKVETEIHPVIVEAKIRKCTNLFALFTDQFILFYFFQKNNFLFHLYFLNLCFLQKYF